LRPVGISNAAIRSPSLRIAGPANSEYDVSRTVLTSLGTNGFGGLASSSSITRPQIDIENCSNEFPRMPALSAVPSVMFRNMCP
jgi:hypothetical protein